MIMQWKRQSSDWVTVWQGIHFTLFEHPTTKRWNLLADGRHVRQTWSKAHTAMEQIDNKQQALIVQAAREMPSAPAPRLRLDLEQHGGATHHA